MRLGSIMTVEEEPRLYLVGWRIVAAFRPVSHHFVGYDAHDGYGRVSSPIQSFDSAHRTGVTRSGRVYELVDESSPANQANAAWDHFCKKNGILEWTDSTLQVSDPPSNPPR